MDLVHKRVRCFESLHLFDTIKLYLLSLLQCDGVEITQKIQDLKLHCLVILNIPRSVEELSGCAYWTQKKKSHL